MNSVLRVLFMGSIAATLLLGCNKPDKEIDNMKSEMGEAVEATKEAAGAVAEETKDAAVEAKEDAVDAIQAAKDAAAADAAK